MGEVEEKWTVDGGRWTFQLQKWVVDSQVCFIQFQLTAKNKENNFKFQWKYIFQVSRISGRSSVASPTLGQGVAKLNLGSCYWQL